jgi:hypothetical protein
MDAPLSIEQENRRALSALRPGVAVGEEVRSLDGFRARSMRSTSVPEISADSYIDLLGGPLLSAALFINCD